MTEAEWALYGTAVDTVRKMADHVLDYQRICPRSWLERVLDWLGHRWRK